MNVCQFVYIFTEKKNRRHKLLFGVIKQT